MRLLALALLAAGLVAGDSSTGWPTLRGPNRSGALTGVGLPATVAIKPVWKARLGIGFTSIAIADGRCYAMGNADDQDTVWCFDAATGKEVWKFSYACKLLPNLYEGGPNATPTVHEGRLYTLSKEGHALCFDAATGKGVWSKRLAQELGAKMPQWGFSGSPTVVGDVVVVNVGSHGAGLDRATGAVRWKSGGNGTGYASPIPFAGGLLVFTGTSLAAVNPATGQVAWEHPWTTQYEVNSADPLVVGDGVFISSGYGYGCALLGPLSGGKPRVAWQNKNMKNHMNACVHHDGSIYGFDMSTLKCLDAASGAEKWAENSLGKGTLILLDGTLVVLSERGELVFAPASPAGFKSTARTQILGGKCWTSPSYADGRVYARNAAGDLVCVGIK